MSSGKQRVPPAGGQPGHRAVLGVPLSGVTQRQAGQPGQPAGHQPLRQLEGHRVVDAQPLQSVNNIIFVRGLICNSHFSPGVDWPVSLGPGKL